MVYAQEKKKCLRPTKQKIKNYKIHGFDIETYNNNLQISSSSFYMQDGYDYHFIRQNNFLEILKKNHSFRKSIVSCTNLAFDFFGSMFQHDEIINFQTLFRGSSLIFAKTYLRQNNFIPFQTENKNHASILKFLDTLNFSFISVKRAGELLGIKKIDLKEIKGKLPKNSDEWYSMLVYNNRDCEISARFMIFLKKSFEDLGATFKDTIASTAMSCFTNKYLDNVYFVHETEDLLEIFQSLYGGRCEVFKRGIVRNLKYYDYNSKYPDVMYRKEYPNPNTHRISYENSIEKIMKYEGCSLIECEAPLMKYPVLPVRMIKDKKVIFPCGKIKGWYTHVEIRKAIEKGYVILKVHKTHYYKETCSPFKEYVKDLYNKRMMYKQEGSPLEECAKILLNSLFGKFGQRFIDLENVIPAGCVDEEFIRKHDILTDFGKFVRFKEKYGRPAAYCIPIWPAYVTAYARLDLLEAAEKYGAYYCDTDSIITDQEIETSLELGKFKLEMTIEEGVIVKPKFYAFKGLKKGKEVEYVKIKGFSKAIDFLEISGEEIKISERDNKFLSYLEFKGFLLDASVRYNKFAKFKEALRRYILPNENIIIKKEFSVEDNKRYWDRKFKINETQESRPLVIKM